METLTHIEQISSQWKDSKEVIYDRVWFEYEKKRAACKSFEPLLYTFADLKVAL